jgi:chemotaxis protein methyltransferase CheR
MDINTDTLLKFFAEYIEKELGIMYSEANYFQLEHRLKDLSHQLGYQTLHDFYLQTKVGLSLKEKNILLDTATNNETSFFRDVTVFKAISEYMIPELLKGGFKSQFNIWSAASSSGQEIYSILMEISELRKTLTFPTVKALASDISDLILTKAQKGIYSKLEADRGLPVPLKNRYFDQLSEDQFQVKSELKNLIDWRKLNLLHDWGAIGNFDIIFCRNVLIYQSVPNKAKVIEEIWKRLNPKGFLVLGAAESLFGISDKFTQVSASGAIIHQKKD